MKLADMLKKDWKAAYSALLKSDDVPFWARACFSIFLSNERGEAHRMALLLVTITGQRAKATYADSTYRTTTAGTRLGKGEVRALVDELSTEFRRLADGGQGPDPRSDVRTVPLSPPSPGEFHLGPPTSGTGDKRP